MVTPIDVPIIITRPITFAAILLFTWIVAEIIRRLVYRLSEFSLPQYATRLKQTAYGVVWILGFLVALTEVGLDTNIIFLTIGVVGIALIVALRDVLTNWFSRPFILTFHALKIGDVVNVGKYTGRIIEVNPLNTVLLTTEKEKNVLVIIPNSTFLKQTVIHKSPYSGLSVKLPIIIGHNTDVKEVEKRILGICKQFKNDINWKRQPIVLPSRMVRNKRELLLLLDLRRLERKAHVIFKLNERIHEMIKRMEEKSI